MANSSSRPFWESKSLAQMSREEWESLCDGCAKCCLLKLEDEETGLIHYTNVVCSYLNQKKCQCTQYKERRRLVPTCLQLEPGELDDLYWMPSTCAYRLLNEKKPLPQWHPLVTGSRKEIVASGNTVTGKVISEEYVHEDGLDEHLITWVY